jgi:hypothetical protein
VSAGGRFVLIDDGRRVEVDADVGDGRVRLSADAVAAALGWAVTPEGLCRDGLCLPVDAGARLDGADGIDLALLAAALDRPLALDPDERAAYLGVSASERTQALRSLWAPDFTLPGLDGRLHTLSAHRGKKVALVAWASW